MKNIKNASWIKSPKIKLTSVFSYEKELVFDKPVQKAALEASALGVYTVFINGSRVGDYYMAPGWTEYDAHVQVETYDVTAMLTEKSKFAFKVAPGWKCGMRPHWSNCPIAHPSAAYLGATESALIFALTVTYADGTEEVFYSDGTWMVYEDNYLESTIYDGYVYDPAFRDEAPAPAVEFPHTKDTLVDRMGEKVVAHERLAVKEIIRTPKSETVLDFGQNMSGYVEFRIRGKKGERAFLQHGEVLDKDGNFYRENLRSAKAEAVFLCDGEEHYHIPEHTFFGFRYVKLNNWSDEVKAENFTAVVIHSDIKRTGYFECSDPRVNQLFSNVIWGQKGNYVDVPTDCPQRDERLGWTGDAEVFVKAATYNFDVERFFEKWLADLRADQKGWGGVPHVIPDVFNPDMYSSAAWADACTVCPWQIYVSYNNKALLEESLDSMRRWLEYIDRFRVNGIWKGQAHFGDWLNLDQDSAHECSRGTEKELIATAYYILSSDIYLKACAACGADAGDTAAKRAESVEAFRREYMASGRIAPDYATQTACVLALHFGITDNAPETAKQLNELVTACGHLKTGFVGTPYLLHALTDNGYAETAYSLLLREEYPSWLFSVKMGATTIWEHWDSLREDGSMWSTGMNSFNHYAYGSVADWLYGDVAGIKADEAEPGYKHFFLCPVTDSRLTYAKASYETRFGTISSAWKTENGKTTYTFTVPAGTTATLTLNGETKELAPGEYEF